MAVTLEGGTRVTGSKEGQPLREGTLSVWRLIGRGTSARAISLRILEYATGISPSFTNPACDEVLYVLEGRGTLHLNGRRHQVEQETGIYLPPGVSFVAENPGPAPLLLASARCPEPDEEPDLGPPAADELIVCSPPATPARRLTVKLTDREARPTGDRWYRVLVDAEMGSHQVTQFVGSIPPGRAPDHYHHYEEVLCVLAGRGIMWAGATSAPIAAGSCIYLPEGQVHCVENAGPGELRLLGVFYPAGSPAVRYGDA